MSKNLSALSEGKFRGICSASFVNSSFIILNILNSYFITLVMPSILLLYKNAYSGLSRSTWYLSLVVLINRSGTMVVPFMTMYATQKLGFSITQAGIIMSLFGLGAVAGAFLGGKLTDDIGFYKIQLAALSGGGLMFITLGYLKTYYSICVGTFLLSIINESFRPANAAAIAYYSKPENRTRSYSLNRLAINLGWAFGGAAGGLLASYNYQLLFWVDGVTNILAAILLFFVLPFPKELMLSIRNNKQQPGAGSSAYKDVNYRWFILLTMLFALCFFQVFTMLPIYYRQNLHLSEKVIGILMALNGLIIALIEMVVIYNLEGKRPPLWYVRWGVLLIGVSYAIFNVVEGRVIIAFISMIIISAGEMLSMPFMNTYWISRSHEYNRGSYAALYSMAWASAQIAGPLVGGWIADRYGFALLWWVIFLITLITGFGFIRLNQISLSPAIKPGV